MIARKRACFKYWKNEFSIDKKYIVRVIVSYDFYLKIYVCLRYYISTVMVDEFNAGMTLAIITLASPVLAYFVLVGLPSVTASNQVSIDVNSQLEKVERAQLSGVNMDYLQDSSFVNSNPGERLRIAYEHSAQSEVDRCLGGGSNEMCADTLALLVSSCADKDMYVAACEDPRFLNYIVTSLKN